ncbi:MAG: TIGR00296 family protein [Candidatus Thorarchaeota archaeon]|nr:TIGR00296 family protein [Candidatus Thorarchaeota archaeon]
MAYVYSDEEGVFLVRLARKTVDQYVSERTKPSLPTPPSQKLLQNSGVFVTLNSIVGDHVSLRGCIGRPYPSQRLIDATVDSAVDAAVNDPRFEPVSPRELGSILIELSVLTEPKRISYRQPSELLDLVKVGRDGLIVTRGMWRGLLLPQVPVEWNWDVKEFLEHTCNKAGLPADAWRDPKTEFMSFQAEIFGEVTPRGDVVRNPTHPRTC